MLVEVEEVSKIGYISFRVNGKEIGQSKEECYSWARKNSVEIVFPCFEATPYATLVWKK